MSNSVEYLVTGGAGFIGSHLVRRLLEVGSSVRVVDNFLTGKRENLSDLLAHPGLELREADITDAAVVREAMSGVQFVLHQAALPSVPRSVSNPATTMSIGVEGTLNVLMAARDAGCERVVLASSSSVYGDTLVLPKVESMLPSPLSPYAVSKLCGEHLCAAFTHLYQLPTIALRYFNVFGPRQDPESQYAAVVPRFIIDCLAGRSPTIHGDGLQTRDFTYIDNVVEANRLCCEAPERAWGKAFNVACGQRVSVKELALKIGALCGGPSLEPHHDAARAGDVKHSLADISRAGELLGFSPAVDLDEGLQRTVSWYKTR